MTELHSKVQSIVTLSKASRQGYIPISGKIYYWHHKSLQNCSLSNPNSALNCLRAMKHVNTVPHKWNNAMNSAPIPKLDAFDSTYPSNESIQPFACSLRSSLIVQFVVPIEPISRRQHELGNASPCISMVVQSAGPLIPQHLNWKKGSDETKFWITHPHINLNSIPCMHNVYISFCV